MEKRIVHYSDVKLPVVVGVPAKVWPVDHPDAENVSGKKWATTSPVLLVTQGRHGPLFETHNTFYRPIEPTAYATNERAVGGFDPDLSQRWREITDRPRRQLPFSTPAYA